MIETGGQKKEAVKSREWRTEEEGYREKRMVDRGRRL